MRLFRHRQMAGLALLLLLVGGCAPTGPNLKTLVATAPEFVIAHQDSLIAKAGGQPETRMLVIRAYVALADSATARQDFSEAEALLSRAEAIDSNNPEIKYRHAMTKGLALYKKGSSSQLWDAIEQFNLAARYKPEDGTAYYWMARGYKKNDDQDFTNIIERYEQCLAKTLSPDLRTKAAAELAEVRQQQKTFNEFWK